jgi:hypothetical protein
VATIKNSVFYIFVNYNACPCGRIPVVESKQYMIKDNLNNSLTSQIVPIPVPVLSIPGM